MVTKRIYKVKPQKMIFWSLLIFTVFAFFLFKARPQGGFSFFLEKAETLLPENVRPDREIIERTNYDEVLNNLKDPQNISYYEGLFLRDIFAPPKIDEKEIHIRLLKVVAIEKAPLPLVFKGYIQKQDGSVIGQLDYDGKTVFVKNGSGIADYKIKSVTKEYIQLVDKDNSIIKLIYQKQLPGEENIAKILNTQDKTTYSIKKGENLFNYLVLDIGDDFVVLLKNNTKFILKKEK